MQLIREFEIEKLREREIQENLFKGNYEKLRQMHEWEIKRRS
jgi:hypothetical protein